MAKKTKGPTATKSKQSAARKKATHQERTEYSVELGLEICERIALCEPLAKICAEAGMASKRTIYRWRRKHKDFAKAYEDARQWRAEARSDRIDEYLEEVRAGTLDAHAARVIVDTEKWLMAKEQPHRYGDKLTAEFSGPDGGPIPLSASGMNETNDLARWIANKLAQAVISHETKLLADV